jgi:hypothetical protein
MISRAKALGMLLVVFAVAGCGDMWGDLWGTKRSAAGAGDGGSCTKDDAVLTQIILNPPACSASSPCPCGSYCSSTVAGVCVVDCRNNDECALGKTCSDFGQCLGAGSNDGGVPVNPACPRNEALLDQVVGVDGGAPAEARKCQFDDICPYGSFCDQTTGLCAAKCRTDGQCMSMAQPGQTLLCDCQGQCVEAATPRVVPTVSLPSMVVSPGYFNLNRPANLTSPNWGDSQQRTIDVSLTSNIVNQDSMGNITGPGASIVVTPGPNLTIQCPTNTNPCTIKPDPATYKQIGTTDNFATAPIQIVVSPAATTSSVTSWDVTFGSTDAADAPRTVSIRYFEPTDVLGGTLMYTTITTVPDTFLGRGSVTLTSPSGKSLGLDVVAGSSNGNLVLKDETRTLSPSGTLVLTSDATQPQLWLDPDNADPVLGQSFGGGIWQELTDIVITQNPSDGHIAGTFNLTPRVDEVQFNTAPEFRRRMAVSFTLTAVDASQVAVCADSSDCTGGNTCDLGFCTDGPAHTFAATSSEGVLNHKRLTDRWGYGFGFAELSRVYAPSPQWLQDMGLFSAGQSLQIPPLTYSGDMLGRFTNSQGVVSPDHKDLKPLAVPLFAQRDVQGTAHTVSEMLTACMTELNRDPPPSGTISSFPPSFDYLTFVPTCIDLGRFSSAVALGGDHRLSQHLLQQWIEVHSFVGREGLEESGLDDVQTAASELVATTPTPDGGAPPPPKPKLPEILSVLESGLGLLIAENTFESPVLFFQADELNAPDYRTHDFLPACIQATDCSPANGQSMDCVAGHCQVSCSLPTDCNTANGQTMDCVVPSGSSTGQGHCEVRSLKDMPQHGQPVGIAAPLMELAGTYFKVLEAYVGSEARKIYGQPNENGVGPDRATILARYGLAMRLGLAVESFAQTLRDRAVAGPCAGPNCDPMTKRWEAARDEFNVTRTRVMNLIETLRANVNPLGIPEDDIPLFFGDPAGTNSRYFASSDYLINGWADPAVKSAQATLQAARDAWISMGQSRLQDELNQHNRAQELDTLKSKYGDPVLANCGNIQIKDGNAARLLRSDEVLSYFDPSTHPFDNDTCYIDPVCLGEDAVDGRQTADNIINLNFIDLNGAFLTVPGSNARIGDLTTQEVVCKIENMATVSLAVKDPWLQKISSVCPPGVPCRIYKGPTDQHVYFGSAASFDPTRALPFAALMRKIRRDELGVGKFYRDADPDRTHPMANGPDDNVYSFLDYAGDTRVVRRTPTCRSSGGGNIHATQCSSYPPNCDPKHVTMGHPCPLGLVGLDATLKDSVETVSGDFLSAAPHCIDGTNGHPSTDYPIPSAFLLPSSCYRGQMGVAWYELQTTRLSIARAKQVLENGKATVGDIAKECELKDMDVATIEQMEHNLEGAQDTYEVMENIAGGVLAIGKFEEGDVAGAVTGLLGLCGEDIAAEQAKIAQFEKHLGRKEDQQKCWDNWREKHRELSTAMLDIQVAMNEMNKQAVVLHNLRDQNDHAFEEGRAVVKREEDSPLSSVGHTYWLDEKVERFKKELEWARRLTFLAMRAVEYEFQQSLPYRSQIVAAVHPDQLEDVVRALQQEQASRTINRRRPEEASIVLSLRDDILSVTDRSDQPEGERAWTPAQRFADRLWDGRYAVRDKKGNWLGQGVPFNVGVTGVLETRCGERMWRATATIQGDGLDVSAPGAPLLLLKKNTFASQFCEGRGDGETLQQGAIHPSAALFHPGVEVDPAEANAFSTAMMFPWFNIRRTDFYKDSYRDGASEELAGRGLYGDYVLLFPKQLLDQGFALDKVEDVLLRIDYLSVDNLSQ